MPLDTQFAFVCQRKFAELAGDSDFKRVCDTCKTEVINLDRLDEEARLAVFEEAARTRIIPCVSITTQLEGSQKCAESFHPLAPLPSPRPTAGLPKLPEKLKEERERIERLRKENIEHNTNPDQAQPSSLLSRLKFW
jgi:hypothetical protein